MIRLFIFLIESRVEAAEVRIVVSFYGEREEEVL